MAKKKRSSSSTRWMKEHFDDQYVQKAQKQGLRSRAAFKLEEIQQRDKILKPGQSVVDLGAAPGGWSQYAAKVVGSAGGDSGHTQGTVIGCDLLPIDALPGVDFIQGDFREQAVLDALLERCGGRADVIMSDMAPNMSGNDSVDQPAAMYLVELALDMARQVLGKDGAMVVKVFQGAGFEQYMKDVRAAFRTVKIRKPDSSRARSREVYVVATGFKLV